MISKRVAIAFLAARMVFKMIGPVVVIKRKKGFHPLRWNPSA